MTAGTSSCTICRSTMAKAATPRMSVSIAVGQATMRQPRRSASHHVAAPTTATLTSGPEIVRVSNASPVAAAITPADAIQATTWRSGPAHGDEAAPDQGQIEGSLAFGAWRQARTGVAGRRTPDAIRGQQLFDPRHAPLELVQPLVRHVSPIGSPSRSCGAFHHMRPYD